MYQLNKRDNCYEVTQYSQLRHGFSTRGAGRNRDVTDHQTFFTEYFGPSAREMAFVTPFQVHSAKILLLKKAPPVGFTVHPGYDGLLYQAEAKYPVCLYVKSADCLTFLLYEPESKLFGAIHLGWQGSYQGIVREVGMQLQSLGIAPHRIRVAFGPSIGDCCYNIPESRAQLFMKKYSSTTAVKFRDGQYYLSLLTLAIEELLKVGVPKANILYKPFCTVCQNNLFFSYRKEAQTKDHLLSFCVANG